MAGLRLIGADAPRLFRLLMVEALLLGATGTAIGIPIGIVLAALLRGMVADSMGEIFQLRFAVAAMTSPAAAARDRRAGRRRRVALRVVVRRPARDRARAAGGHASGESTHASRASPSAASSCGGSSRSGRECRALVGEVRWHSGAWETSARRCGTPR